MIKTIAIAAITSLLVALGFVGLVGNQNDEALGVSGSRFPNGISTNSTSPVAGQVRSTTLTVTGASTLAGVSATTLAATGALTFGSAGATTSINVGKVCYTITSATGTVFYLSYNGQGILATSTTSCN